MNLTLNFGKEEIEKVKDVMKLMKQGEPKSRYELMRCGFENSTLTLYSSGKLLIQGADAQKAKNVLMRDLKLEEERVFGIDETGRGENFGPFVIAGVLGEKNELRELRDSKKIKKMKMKEKSELVTEKSLLQAVVSINAQLIDELRANGINMNQIEELVINRLNDLVEDLGLRDIKYRVDGNRLGGVRGPVEFIVKGDDKDPVIGSASVLAKNTREESRDKRKRESWQSKN